MPLPANQTIIVSCLLFCVTLGILQLNSSLIASTDQLRIFGGFGCSLLFFWSMMIIGNIDSDPSWVSVLFSISIAVLVGSTIHPMCITTSFLFSAGLAFYLQWAAQKIHQA